jgi:hypothetical protein
MVSDVCPGRRKPGQIPLFRGKYPQLDRVEGLKSREDKLKKVSKSRNNEAR